MRGTTWGNKKVEYQIAAPPAYYVNGTNAPYTPYTPYTPDTPQYPPPTQPPPGYPPAQVNGNYPTVNPQTHEKHNNSGAN